MTLQHQDIIKWLWQRQGGSVAFLSTKRWTRWTDIPIPTSFHGFDFTNTHGVDVYWTPLTFIEPHRSNDTVAGARCLFADLDPVDPRTLSIQPSMAWETSLGSYQALWLVEDEMGYSRFANLNKRLTMLTGADAGGWMGSKLLRWPGTLNHKYDPPRQGRLLWWDPHLTYTVDYFEEALPAIPNRPNIGAGNVPATVSQGEANNFIADRWESLPLHARALLMKERVPDRSMHIVRTINELLKSGLSPEVTYNMIWWRPWNKWRTDRNNPGQLWAEINRAQMRLVE